MEEIKKKFKEVLIKVFRYGEEDAENYINNDDKWIDEETIYLPNEFLLSYSDNTFLLWKTISDEDWFTEMLSKELSIDVENNKVAQDMINILMHRVVSEINNKTSFEACIDQGFIHTEKSVKSIEDVAEAVKKDIPKLEEIKRKLETYKCIYEYLTPAEIQRLFLSKVTYVAPVQIKRIGGSYGVIIPVNVLKMFVDENKLEKGAEITAKLRANANTGEIILSEFEEK